MTTTKTFTIGQKIRAYDFKPMEGRNKFIEGHILNTGWIKHPTYGHDMFEGYTIRITNADRANDPRIGDIGYVPFDMDFQEFEGRITKLETLKIENAKHSYDVEVSVYKNGKYHTSDGVEVFANNRAQAGSMARKAGYEVRSVNMIG